MEQPTQEKRTRGQAGGRAVRAKYGVEHLQTIGQKGGRTTAARHGREHMRRIGRVGFAVTVARHFGGDKERAINTLIHRGLMAQDPCPANGAWTRPDVPHRYTDPAKARETKQPR
jgi:general stress protein YciG